MNVNPFMQTLNPIGQQMQQETQKFQKDVTKRLHDQVVAVFANPHGMQLLDTLDDLYVRQPVCPAGCVEGYGYLREGENRLILRLRSIVNAAQQASFTSEAK